MDKKATHGEHFENGREELFMIITKEGKFAGKCRLGSLENMEDGIELRDCVNMIDMGAERGIMTVGIYLGNTLLYPSNVDNLFVVTLEKTSSYFSAYYQATSNLHLGRN